MKPNYRYTEVDNVQMTSWWDKFCLLMWKNWLLQIRHKVQTIVEILIPVAFSGLLVLIRSLVDPTDYPTYTYDELRIDNFTDISKIRFFELSKLFSKLISFKNVSIPLSFEIGYSPKNPILDKFMRFVKKGTRLRINALANATELERHLIANSDFAGIEFSDKLANITTLPIKLEYAFRFPGELRNNFNNPNPIIFTWRTDFRFPVFQPGGARNYDYSDGGAPPGYYAERFIHLQHVVFNAYVGMMNATNETLAQIPNVFLRRFPYPAFTQDPLLQGLEGIASLIILLSFVYPCINIVKFITTEKEKQLKEAMKIMGLANWLHWTAWFVKCILFLIVTITCMVVLLTISWYPDTEVSVFTHSNRFALWLFLFIYSISTIMFCFMLSVFFSKANTGAAVAGLLWFVTYAPYTFIAQRLESIGVVPKLIACLFSNSAMGFGIKIIIRHEGTDEGLQWGNFFKPVSIDDNFSIGHVTLMLLVDCVLYLLITLYVEKVMPGDYGVPEPWYFPVTKKFWQNTITYHGATDDVFQDQHNQENVEPEPLGKEAGVRVKNLRKVYSNKKTAVQGLTLNMYEDQITVLLGHNGAGKTTTMSMLTGMIPPTSGTALISGKDIRTDIEKVRGSLGLCPQHNILFDELTVREHIQFYSRLKGMEKSATNQEVQKYVTLLQLENKIDKESRTLSGGMQRKLSVGVALCAGSKVVLCDEPTSGIDPAARRALWDLLLQEKKGRTILLSTHFMDEADILGDRIAIMADGDLKAVGSSFYLKKKFGVGYRLVCVKNTGCVTGDVTKLLKKYIPDATIKTNIGSELSYQLKDENVDVFQTMLEDLESNSEDLKLLNYGISLTTMEEVFMKVGSDYTNDENDEPAELQNGHANSDETFETPFMVSGLTLMANQIVALFKKRMYHTYRNWVLYMLQNIIPVIFLVLTISIVRTWRGNDDLPPFKLDLEQYNPTVTLLQSDGNLTSDNVEFNFTETYRDIYKKAGGRQQLLDMPENNMTEYFLKLSRAQQTRVNAQYLIGATVARKNLTAWFNNQPYHAAPITINMAHNVILKTLFGEESQMEITNKPLPFKPETRFHMLQAGNNLGFQLAFNLGFAMSFVAAFYIIVYIKERSTKAKLLQFVSGVNVVIYWLTALIWDYFTFIITALVCLLTLVAFQEPGWASFDELGRTFVVLLCFGWAVLPMLYLASMMFSQPATGFTRMSIFFIFTGIAMFTVIFSMRFDGFKLQDTAETMTQVFSVFPHFALSDSFSNLNIINVVRKVCQARCDMLSACEKIEDLCFIPVFSRCCETNYFSYKAPGISRHLTYMVCTGTVLLSLLILVELRVFEYLFYKSRHLYKGAPIPLSQDGFVDEDVSAENARIHTMNPDELQTHNLIMKDMTKLYKKFLAVNQLNVAVDPYECFGLLGINGAGKTSTFKMLIGDEKISKGDAWLQGVSLKTNMKEVHKRIGYCPQFDALIDDLTGRETLDFYCLLRGVPKEEIPGVTLKLATELNFMKHIDKLVKEYSGGNKRKLSTAVAMIGNPSVIYLDEPTTGMDPGAKRHLWSVICKIRNQGRSIVLTSHSMEECEALCTRLAIMVNGEFKCLGSVQHLKSKFAKGFLLTIKASNREKVIESIRIGSSRSLVRTPSEESTKVDKIKEFIGSTFSLAVLKEEFQGLLTYQIPTTDLKWSKIFGIMEKAKSELSIEDYSLGQTSLEQVFLAFAKYQRPEDE